MEKNEEFEKVLVLWLKDDEEDKAKVPPNHTTSFGALETLWGFFKF